MSTQTSSAPVQGSPWPNRIILAIYFVCFSVGTYAHLSGVIAHGFLYQDPSDPHIPVVILAMIDALTFLNPLTLLLLIVNRRAGIISAVAVVALVFARCLFLMPYLWFTAHFLYISWLLANGTMGLFMLATARRLWRAAGPAAPALQATAAPSVG
ncbi:hypothetical protein KRR26_34535 [Corallococcus sp. M34]|uniref:hypothetical protein n=1 Tax=Citreicoccus inhibens TaxID=2849499 RepID=UPI001C251050|nr:hypothetical protein [Citreicoccus inhibens]MBU8900736.1 hypothetical protein [Citreicoccus inhibens]